MNDTNELPEKKSSSHYVNNAALLEALVQWRADLKQAVKKKLPKPPVPDYVAECMVKMANRISQKAGFINYCVDEETEMLTKRGWLWWNEVTTDDIALSCDPADHQMKWGPIHDIYRAPFDGNMFHLTGNGVDSLVTPHHKFLTAERGLAYVETLLQKEHLVLMGKAVADPSTVKYSDAFVKLVGWSVTEGNYRLGKTTHGVNISQKKQDGIDDIVSALEESGAKWSTNVITEDDWRDYVYETDDGRLLTSRLNKKGMHYFHVTGPVANAIVDVSPDRVLSSDFISSLTQEQRLLLIETMVNGDGWKHTRANGTVGRFYCQKDKTHLDFFTLLCATAGIRTTERLRTIESPFGKGDIWYVNLCEGDGLTKWGTKSTGCKVENIDFHGSQRDLTCAPYRGEDHPLAKLTLDQILEARVLNSQGISFKKLGPMYGVSRSTIHRAVTGQRYKDYSLVPQKAHQASTPYKGMIWCPQTSYKTFVSRRNGKVYVTSNTYREDMIGDSLESCLRYIHNFDPTKSNNPFAYITQIIHNAFIRRIQKEQKQLYVKMKIADEADFTDSYERQEGDHTSYNNSYVTYLKENKGEVISKFEGWKENKKNKATAKKKETELLGLFEEEVEKIPEATDGE